MIQKIKKWFQEKTNIETANYLKHKINDFLSRKDFASAEPVLKQLVEIQPDAEHLNILSKTLLRQGKKEEALTFFKKASSLDLQYLLGEVEMMSGRSWAQRLRRKGTTRRGNWP